jgi:hypothetical protein
MDEKIIVSHFLSHYFVFKIKENLGKKLVDMLKIIFVQLLIICLMICFEKETRCVQALHKYPLRKFSLKFKESRNMMENRRRKEEEQRKLEQIEQLRRKVIEEHLLSKITGETTVLRDFYSRF